jgi:transcriptional regulator with XRE-family HTH domain
MKKFKEVESVEIPEIDIVLSQTPPESKNFISKTLDIVDQIFLILEEKGINQKYLADKLGKKEPEISKWLSGTHNFTVRTITAIETALDHEIIVTPHKIKDNLFRYATKAYRASAKEKRPTIADKKGFSTQAGESNYALAA